MTSEKDNDGLWKILRDVPKNARKDAIGKGFNCTTIDPMWRAWKLTETFGAVGQGWGFESDPPLVVTAHDNVCVFVTVRGWYMDGNTRCECPPATGGTMISQWKKDGKTLMAFDEACKMAETDGFGKSFSWLGLGADVYMGGHDGDKYMVESSPRGNPESRQQGSSQGNQSRGNQQQSRQQAQGTQQSSGGDQNGLFVFKGDWRLFPWPYGVNKGVTLIQLHQEGKLVKSLEWFEKQPKTGFGNPEVFKNVCKAIDAYFADESRNK